MISLGELRGYAALADMTYTDLSITDIGNNNLVKAAAVVQTRTPEKLGDHLFDSNWTVADYYGDENPTTGFAATLFRRGSEVVLGTRGSEPPSDQAIQDWLTSNFFFNILNFGVVVDQAVSLFNYVQRLRAPEGETSVFQLDYTYTVGAGPVDATYTLSHNTGGVGLGLLQAGDIINVVGHSLGGHLAVVAKRLFPALFADVHTFNGENFGHKAEVFFQRVNAELVEAGETLRAASSWTTIEGSITQYESEDSEPGSDISIVPAGYTGAVRPGAEMELRTEVNSHSVGQITDDLFIFAVLERLSPTSTPAKLFAIYDATQADAGKTQEHLVESLSALLLDDFSSIAETEASLTGAGEFAARTALHERLALVEQKLDDTPAYQNLKIVSVDSLANHATANTPEGLAYRYALVELNPFAITGSATLYDIHNPNGELNWYDPATGQRHPQWQKRR